mgnify:CR=1 FL=1
MIQEVTVYTTLIYSATVTTKFFHYWSIDWVKQSHSIMSQTRRIFCPIITHKVLSVMMMLLPCGAFNLQLNQQQFCLWIAVNFFIAWWWKFEADMRVFHHWCLAGWLVFVRRGNKSEFCRLLLMLVRLMNVIWRSARSFRLFFMSSFIQLLNPITLH